jgi:hypothetical protein
LCEAGQGCGGSAKEAGDVKKVPWAGGEAEQGTSPWNRADQDDIGKWDWRFRQVAAGKWSFVSGGQGQQAVEEALDPGLASSSRISEFARQAQGQEGGHRARSHGGKVAETASKGPVADGFCRVPVEPEVTARDGKIRGDR